MTENINGYVPECPGRTMIRMNYNNFKGLNLHEFLHLKNVRTPST